MHVLVISDDGVINLYRSIVIRAIKDYQYPQYKQDVTNWVCEMQDMFPLCAEAMGMSAYTLREIMVDKMIQIDTLGTAHLYLNGEVRMRK
jgi:hypothetical protein